MLTVLQYGCASQPDLKPLATIFRRAGRRLAKARRLLSNYFVEAASFLRTGTSRLHTST